MFGHLLKIVAFYLLYRAIIQTGLLDPYSLLMRELQQANRNLADTTARAEEKAEEAKRRAAELDTVITSIADGVIIYGRDGKPLQMNRAAELMLGFTPEEARVPLEYQVALLHIATAEGTPLTVEVIPAMRALQGATVLSFLLTLRSRDGRSLWVAQSAAPIRAATGDVVAAVVTMTDVTTLQELQRQQEDLLHTVSHDLRTPLAIISGQAQILGRQLEKAGQDRGALRRVESIVASTRRMNSMIRDLVDSARLRTGQLQLSPSELNLRQFVLELRERMAATPEGGGERIRLEAPEGLTAVWADPDRLERILTNLIGNALKYSESSAEVVVRIEQRGDAVVTSVRDRGRGIASEELPRLINRYYRTQAGREHQESLGLGLYITRLLVEAHGGQIWVESEVGKGSTLGFSLPTTERGEQGPMDRQP